MVIELKRNDCPESAIEQIKKKKYAEALDGYEGRLLFVGINYDENVLKYTEKTHSAKIEELSMDKFMKIRGMRNYRPACPSKLPY